MTKTSFRTFWSKIAIFGISIKLLRAEHFSKYTFFEKNVTKFLLHLKRYKICNNESIQLKLRPIDYKFDVDMENVVKMRKQKTEG